MIYEQFGSNFYTFWNHFGINFRAHAQSLDGLGLQVAREIDKIILFRSSVQLRSLHGGSFARAAHWFNRCGIIWYYVIEESMIWCDNIWSVIIWFDLMWYHITGVDMIWWLWPLRFAYFRPQPAWRTPPALANRTQTTPSQQIPLGRRHKA